MNFKVLDIEISNNVNLGFTISGKSETYMRVVHVNPTGLAFKAGLKCDDCILSINGIKINSKDDIMNSVQLSEKEVTLQLIRYSNLELENKPTVSVKDPKVFRKYSKDFQTLHHDLLSNLGSKIDMEISRSPAPIKKSLTVENVKLSKRSNSDVNKLRRTLNTNTEFKKNLEISRYHSTRRNSYQASQSTKPIEVKSRKLSDSGTITTHTSSVVPISFRKSSANVVETKERPVYSSRSWSLRKKAVPMPTLFQNQSLFNISNLDKSIASSPLIRDLTYSRPVSMTKTISMVSLFDEDGCNSIVVDYSIDWQAIFEKITEKTTNDIENELVNYFHNCNADLKSFPINCLHRFLTFDDVLEIVFNDVLNSDFHGNFNDEILKYPTKVIKIDYDLKSYDVCKLIRCNVRHLEGMVGDYITRKSNLGHTLERLKESLSKFLIRPENLTKVHREIDNICIKFQRLSDVLILIITSMSTWKLNKDFPDLYVNKRGETTTLRTCEIIFAEFRDSQKKLEQQIIKLFKQFNDDYSAEVLHLFDQMFSENLEVSICLPIFEDKLRKDNQMLSELDSCNKVTVREEQFV